MAMAVQSLRQAALASDFQQVMEGLLWNADVNWADPEEESRTVLHALSRCTSSSTSMLEFLLQNGAEVLLVDDR